MKTDKVSVNPSDIFITGEVGALNPPEFRRWSKLQWLETAKSHWCLNLLQNRSIRIKLNQLGTYEVWWHDKGMAQHRRTERSLRAAIEAGDALVSRRESQALSEDAAWRSDPPGEAQCSYLFRLDGRRLRDQGHEDGGAFYRFALAEYERGNLAYSKGSIASLVDAEVANFAKSPVAKRPIAVPRKETLGAELANALQQAAANENKMRTLPKEIAEAEESHAEATKQLIRLEQEPWSERLFRAGELRDLRRKIDELARHIKLLKAQHDTASQDAARYHRETTKYRDKIAEADRRAEATARRSKMLHEREERKVAKLEANRAIAARALGKDRDVATVARRQLPAGPECPYCGAVLSAERHLDHIFPISLGGLSINKNLVWVCIPCNLKKSNRTLNQFIDETGLDRDRVYARLRALRKHY
jgi:5-methylcytosine-specific restriction endonuclease McrA